MPKNASPRDARAGYTLFRGAGGDIGLDDLNERLVTAGYGPVSERMHTHYRSLAKANYDRYISINRFDVARAASRYEDLGASPRYEYSEVGEGVRMLIAKANRLWQASARVEQIGEAGAIVRLVDDEYKEGLTKAKVSSGDFVSLTFLESGRSADGRIIEIDSKTDPPLIEVQFTALVSLADLAVGTAAPTAQLGIRLRSIDDDADAVTTDQLGRRLFLLFEIVDEIRYIANFVSHRVESESREYSPPAVVERLNVASPAETILIVSEVVQSMFPYGVIATLARAAWQIPEKRKVWHEGTGAALDNEGKRTENDIKQAQLDRDLASLDLAITIRQAIEEHFDIEDDLSDEVQRLAEERVAPLVESLGATGVDSVEDALSEGPEPPSAAERLRRRP